MEFMLRTHYQPLSRVKWIQSTPLHLISLRSILILPSCPHLGLLSSGILTKPLYTFLPMQIMHLLEECCLLECYTVWLLIAFLLSVLQLLVTANVVPNSQNLLKLMMEAIRSSETLILTRATQHNISEHSILHGHRLKSHNASSCFRPFWIGHKSDDCLLIQPIIKVSLLHILIGLSMFTDTSSCQEYPHLITDVPQFIE
jgi:hypothetical protein